MTWKSIADCVSAEGIRNWKWAGAKEGQQYTAGNNNDRSQGQWRRESERPQGNPKRNCSNQGQSEREPNKQHGNSEAEGNITIWIDRFLFFSVHICLCALSTLKTAHQYVEEHSGQQQRQYYLQIPETHILYFIHSF
jgi:hypothetical protein